MLASEDAMVEAMIEAIRQKVADGRYEFSQHAVDQAIVRRISVAEIRDAIASGEVIEDYPDDMRGPSCLVLGYTSQRRPLHVHLSHPSRPLVKIITVYEPEPARWHGYRTRRI
jgi:hypothetical protein